MVWAQRAGLVEANVVVPFLVTMRTADRTPKPNYLATTVRSFLAGGCDPSDIHLFPTSPDVAWLTTELDGLPDVCVHVPDRLRGPNENGIRQVSALEDVAADWIGLFEDDIELCADPVGSMTRWLSMYARPDIHVYRFCALPQTPTRAYRPEAVLCPLREMRGSQAVVLRADDALAFREWATQHPKDWRPKGAPFQDKPDRGFDKLVGYWALQHDPLQTQGLLSRPMMVRHIGRQSALHSHGISDDRAFAGVTWRYDSEGTVH